VSSGVAKWAAGESEGFAKVLYDAVRGCTTLAGSIRPLACLPGKLKKIGQNTWQSTAGIVYGVDPDPRIKNRVRHVLEHFGPPFNPKKPTHSVFTIDRTEVLALIDQAWVSPSKTGIVQGGREIFTIPIVDAAGKARLIGKTSASAVTATLTKLKIVVEKGTTKLVSAYPIP
jgi:filamentous hemagglutinin